MSLANRLSSKFHSYPRSFASRQTVYFSDNLLDTDIISSDIPADGRGLFTKYIKQLYINILYVWKWIKTSLGTCSCRYFAAPPISNEHSVIWFCLWQLSILYIFMGGRGWRSWQDLSLPTTRSPVQSPDLPRFELICVTFFPASANSAFHSSGLGKWVPVPAGN